MFRLNRKCDEEIVFKGVTYQVDLSFDNVLNVIDSINGQKPGATSYSASLLVGEPSLELSLSERREIVEKVIAELIEKETTEPVLEYDLDGNPMPVPTESDDDGDAINKATYSLTHDATSIYTSFIAAYNIDLHRSFGRIHWHEFNALIRDLPEETAFGGIVKIRSTNLSDIKDKKEKERMRKLKKIYALPQDVEE